MLKKNFFTHPFIRDYLERIGKRERFGAMSNWLHNKVTDVPVPFRAEIKEIQININQFIVELSDDYIIDVPGSRSEFLTKLSE